MRMHRVILFLCIVFLNSLHSQNINIDSLLHKNIEQLEIHFSILSKEKQKEITKLTLIESKKANDFTFLFKAYFLKLMETSHRPLSIKYADSLLYVAHRTENKKLRAYGHLYKGIQLYYQSEYNESLSYYLKAQEYFKSLKEEFYNVKIHHYVGLLKNSTGNEKDALSIFKKNLSFFNDDVKNQTNYSSQYLKSLFALTDSYIRNNLLVSADSINRLGLKKSIKLNDYNMYPHFLMFHGNIMNFKDKPQLAIDSLLKATKLLKHKKKSLSGLYRIIAEAYNKQGNNNLYLRYLNKVDSIYKIHSNVIFHAREVNKKLYDYYKKIKNYKEQLRVTNNLLTIDSILQVEHSELEKGITKGYDLPNLISKRESLITLLKEKRNTSQKISIAFVIISVLALYFAFYFFRKNYILRKRFQLLIQQIKDDNRPKENLLKQEEASKIQPTDISKDLIEKILKKIEKFEKSQRFLKKKYTLNSLAKELNTNSTYLSKVINSEKNTNFSNYLNNLKIDYAINRLSDDKQFRLYTIKAISEESGFNSQLTFSQAFYKKTKLQPSYFIKQLSKI